MIINISRSPYHFGKQTLRFNMVQALARRHLRPVVYVNQVGGGNDDLLYDGCSFAVVRDGTCWPVADLLSKIWPSRC